jgi:hypothetical protein
MLIVRPSERRIRELGLKLDADLGRCDGKSSER